MLGTPLRPPSFLKEMGGEPEGAPNLLDVQMSGWHGRCEVHEKFTVKDIETVRQQFPDVVILSHPECSPEVVAASDFSGSTNAMIRYVQQSKAPHYLLLTECAMGDNVAAANPEKDMLRLCMVRCPYMIPPAHRVSPTHWSTPYLSGMSMSSWKASRRPWRMVEIT